MPRDVFRFINDLDAATVDRIAARLEFRATDPGYVAFRDAYFAKLPLPSAPRVLALGCGAGVEVRALRQRPEFNGEIIGIDQSPRLIEEARRLTAAEGLDRDVEYQIGDAHQLDLPDESFDVVLAHTIVSHVTDPLSVLREARRVVKPGGIVAIFDGDYASLTFSHSDPDLAKRVEETLLKSSGLLPQDEVERWRTELAQSVEEGTFFGASNYYTYLARRPTEATTP